MMITHGTMEAGRPPPDAACEEKPCVSHTGEHVATPHSNMYSYDVFQAMNRSTYTTT